MYSKLEDGYLMQWLKSFGTPTWHNKVSKLNSQILHFQSNFLLMYALRGSRQQLKYLDPCHHVGDLD